MSTLLLAVLLATLAAPPAAAAARGRGIAVLVDSSEAAERPELDEIAARVRARADASYVTLDEKVLGDPILRGRVLAGLSSRALVVAVGDGAAEFAAREMSDAPVYFVGVQMLRGERLAAPGVCGDFSYSVSALLDAVARLRLGRIGLAYTPGYEPVAGWIRRGAAERGLSLSEARVDSAREVAPVFRGLLASARTIWVVGDPLVARGAAFEFLRERALSRGAAVIAPDARSVRRGALLTFEASPDALGRRAARTIDALLRGAEPAREGLRPGPDDGSYRVNAALAEKWRLIVPKGPAWRLQR